MQSTLLEEGLMMMAIGMGTVFVFLACLVVITIAMSALVGRFGGGESPPADSDGATDDPQLLAVIAAAIHRYRRGRR